MKYQLILFDYNGTLVNTPFKDGKPIHILKGVHEKLLELAIAGIKTGVCTNQAGPAWNMATDKNTFPTVEMLANELRKIMLLLPGIEPRPWYISLYDSRVMGMLKARYELEQLIAPEEVMQQLQKAMHNVFGRAPYVHIGIDKDWRKPAPGMLTFAREQAKVEASETLYVGDLVDDATAARAAGMHFAWADEFFQRGEHS